MIGDIFGRPGRRAVRECLDEIVRAHGVEFVVANAENAAAGFGLTRDIARELFDLGVDVLTSGCSGPTTTRARIRAAGCASAASATCVSRS